MNKKDKTKPNLKDLKAGEDEKGKFF